MPTIPTTEQTVRMSPPSLQEYKIPGAVPGAFGELTAEAGQKLGNTMSNISVDTINLIAGHNENLAKIKDAELTNQYLLGTNDLLYSNDEESRTDAEGNTYTIPKGIMFRYGNQADKAILEFIPKEMELRNKILEGAHNDSHKAELSVAFDRLSISSRENVIKHQTEQMRTAAKNTFGATRKTLIDTAASASEPIALAGYFDSIAKNNASESAKFGSGDEATSIQNNKDFAAAADNAATAKLMKTGDAEEAKALLSGVSEYLLPDSFNEITKKLDTMSSAIKKRFDDEKKLSYKKNTVELSKMVADRTLTPETVRKWQEEGKIDSETASIYYGLSIDKKYEIPENTPLGEPDYFLNKLEDNIDDQKQVEKILKEATVAYGDGKLGIQQYRYFIQGAENALKGDNAWTHKTSNAIKNIWGTITGHKKATKAEAAKAVDDLLKASLSGQDPVETSKNIMKSYNLQKNPYIVSAPEGGGVFMDENGAMKLVFPDGVIVNLDEKHPEGNK